MKYLINFFSIFDNSLNKYYAFDIRELYKLFKQKNYSNPYTLSPLHKNIISQVMRILFYLNSKNVLINLEKIYLKMQNYQLKLLIFYRVYQIIIHILMLIDL